MLILIYLRESGLEWITILVFVLLQGAVMVFGDSDYVGMVMIMFRNTGGDYRYFGWEPSAQGVFGFTPPGQT